MSGEWKKLGMPNLARISVIKCYWMTQNARLTAFTVFELLRENKQGVKLLLLNQIRVKKKDLFQKNELHKNYKIYRNLISALMKRSKQNYSRKYFESNWTNTKNTWRGVKNIISMTSSSLATPTLLTF